MNVQQSDSAAGHLYAADNLLAEHLFVITSSQFMSMIDFHNGPWWVQTLIMRFCALGIGP